VSIKDIAQEAGVSPSTVSRALHNHPQISTETGERVQRLAQEMGYTPSLLARSLVTQDTATIGLVITYTADPFLSRLVQGVEETARNNGYSVFLSSSYRDYERELEVVRSFHERRTSGIIITGSQIDTDYLELDARFPLPIVLINCRTYPYSVSADKKSGAKQAVELLVQLGHRRIAFVSNAKLSTDRDRKTSYQQVLRKHDIPIDDTLIVEGDGKLEISAYLSPPLTTVRQPCYRMGQAAIRMLLQLIRGESDMQAEVLPTELIVRQTTGLAPAPEPS